MDFTNRQVLNKGLDALEGKWPIACGAYFTIALISVILAGICSVIQTPLAGVISYVLSNVLRVILFFGLSIFTLKIVQNKPVYFSDIFRGFNYYKKIIPLALLFCGLEMINLLLYFIALESSGVFWLVFFAWLVIYAIISLMLSQVYFVLIENSDMKVVNILATSRNMIYGYKWQLFSLFLIFMSLGILCGLTLGIGLIWAVPYAFTCEAQFYLELKQRYHSAD